MDSGLTLANAGTALLWWSGCFLVFANLVIGVIEAGIVFGFWKMKPVQVLVFIAANYASAWVGALLLPLGVAGYYALVGDRWLDSVDVGLWVFVATFTVLSFVVEVQFLLLIPKVYERVGRFILRFGAAQLVTNVIVGLVFVGLSTTDGQGWLRVVDPEAGAREVDAAFAESAWVYYLDENLEAVRRVRLDGTRDESVLSLSGYEMRAPKSGEHALFPNMGSRDGRASLVLGRFGYSDDWDADDVTLIEDVGLATGDVATIDGFASVRQRPIQTIDLRDTTDRSLTAWAWDTGFFGELRIGEGDAVWRRGIDRRIKTSTPLGSWMFSAINVIPGDVAVFSLRASESVEIWCLDLEDGRSWRIATGYSPAVVLSDEAE